MCVCVEGGGGGGGGGGRGKSWALSRVIILYPNSGDYYILTQFLFFIVPKGWEKKSWAFTMQLFLQCGVFSGAVMERKLLSLLFHVGGGSGHK